jgi:hypothetical protein
MVCRLWAWFLLNSRKINLFRLKNGVKNREKQVKRPLNPRKINHLRRPISGMEGIASSMPKLAPNRHSALRNWERQLGANFAFGGSPLRQYVELPLIKWN